MKKNEILLIQGPPGTGKTHTILGLISMLLKNDHHSKILICAPSNAAIDEISARLAVQGIYNSELKKVKCKFLRFGLYDRKDKEKKYLETLNGKILIGSFDEDCNIKNGKMEPELEEEFEKMRPKEMRKKDKEENYDDELDYDLILGSSSDSCLLSKEKTTEILERDYGIIDNDPKEEMRFIVGKCHPVVLVPGMLSTKLQVRINCANLFSEEFEIYKKIKFYCGKFISI